MGASIDYRLLRSQRNVVFGLVQKVGLMPTDFRWDEVLDQESDYQISIITHIPGGFYYRFGSVIDRYSPGLETQKDMFQVSPRWESRFQVVSQWLKYVKREQAPDLWGMILQETKLALAASSPVLTNDAFTQVEKQQIVHLLAEVKDQVISSHRLQLEQKEAIDQGFSYLADSLDRFGKKDWLNLAMGTLLSTATGAAFAPDVAQDMYHRLMAAIEPLFQSILKLLG